MLSSTLLRALEIGSLPRAGRAARVAVNVQDTSPGRGPVYWVGAPSDGKVTPKMGASASHRSLNGRFPVPVGPALELSLCCGSGPSVTFRNVPPLIRVFLPPNTSTGTLSWR